MILKYATIYYDREPVKQEGTKDISNIKVYSELEHNGQNSWIASTYKSYFQKTKNKYVKNLQVVIESKKGNDVYYLTPPISAKVINLNNGNLPQEWRKLSVYEAKKQKTFYYYEPSIFKPSKQGGSDQFVKSFTGHSTSGTVNIFRVEKLIAENLGSITFEPSSMTVRDYEEILKDLYNIHVSLLISDKSLERIGVKEEANLFTLLDNIEELDEAIEGIILNPNTDLKPIWGLVSVDKTIKFNPKIEVQKKINPGKKTYFIPQLLQTENTKENYLIKQTLCDLLNYFKMYRDSLSIDLNEANNSLTMSQRNNTINKVIERPINSISNSFDFSTRKSDNILESKPIELHRFFAMNKITNRRLNYREATSEVWIFGNILKSNFMPFSIEFKDNKARDNNYIRTHELISNHVLSHFLIEKFVEKIKKDLNYYSTIKIEAEIENNGKYRKITKIFNIIINNESIEEPTSEELLEWIRTKEYSLVDPTSDSKHFKESLLHKENNIENQKKYYNQRLVKVNEGSKKIEKSLDKPLFKQIKLTNRIENVPTQLFLHNPFYKRAWDSLENINDSIEFSIYAKEENLTMGTLALPNLYEKWTYFKIINLLINNMGWRLENSDEVKQNIIEYYKLESDNFTRQKDFERITMAKLSLGNYRVHVIYEPRLHFNVRDIKENHLLTPDILIRFFKNNQKIGDAILDVKFRDYHNSPKEWWDDIENIAFNKYICRIDEKVDKSYNINKNTIKNSSIIHSDTTLDNYVYFPFDLASNHLENNYVYEKKQKFLSNGKSLYPQKLSSLPFTPNNTKYFNNWLRMMMEFHFGDADICWNCGNYDNIIKEERWTRGGYKAYYYTCHNCNEFWVSTHCQECGNKIYKHLENYHTTRSRSEGERWNIQCPKCFYSFS